MSVPNRALYATCAAVYLLACAAAVMSPTLSAQESRRLAVATRSTADIRDWDQQIDRMARNGALRLRQEREDTLLAGRTHQRFDQYHRGVRVFGADVSRQLDGGRMISAYGVVYEGIALDPTPAIDGEAARAIVQRRGGVALGPGVEPELMVLPLDNFDGGGFALVWRLRAATEADVRQYFIDARSGSVVLEYSDLQTQTAVGVSQGVLGDSKKISVAPETGRFTAVDRLRPPVITTYDMQGDPARSIDYLNTRTELGQNDLASDSDNRWTDGAVGDAHVYAGWTYDYYYHRFGRRGLDNGNISIYSLVHPVRRSDFSVSYFNRYPNFFANAGYYGGGVMVYGEGLPPNVTLGGQVWDYLAGSLDVVGHELTHGVTDYSSRLIYRNESGALNEAFSDMMGTSIEFYFQPAGDGSMKADYLLGEDVVRPGGLRSMADPGVWGDPDHYSKRFLGSADNGGVHINSGIANHAFYLAIEGGSNRTSGLSVQGVSGANREQVEKVFYRAFTQLLPANATFSVARAATIQAAVDLYGANSSAARAVTEAWTAVGVN
jgi:thermolysin